MKMSPRPTRWPAISDAVVAAVRVAGDALGDDAIDDAVEASDGAARSQVSWRREPERHHAEASQPGAEVLRQHFRRLRGVVRVAGEVGVEERLADDGLRERHHLGMDIDRRAHLPACDVPLGEGAHDIAVAGDALTMEGRLHEAALAQPRLALRQQQAVAEQRTQQPHAWTLDEIAIARDK